MNIRLILGLSLLALMISIPSTTAKSIRTKHHRSKRTIGTIVDMFKNLMKRVFSGTRGGRYLKYRRPRPSYGPPSKPSYQGANFGPNSIRGGGLTSPGDSVNGVEIPQAPVISTGPNNGNIDSYGSPQAPIINSGPSNTIGSASIGGGNIDSYGSPQAPVISPPNTIGSSSIGGGNIDSYGSPQAPLIGSSNNFGSQGSNSFVSQGSNNFVSQGTNNLASQGSNNFASQGSTNFVSQGSNNFVSQGSNNFVSQGSNIFGSQGSNGGNIDSYGSPSAPLITTGSNNGLGSQGSASSSGSFTLPQAPAINTGGNSDSYGSPQASVISSGSLTASSQIPAISSNSFGISNNPSITSEGGIVSQQNQVQFLSGSSGQNSQDSYGTPQAPVVGSSAGVNQVIASSSSPSSSSSLGVSSGNPFISQTSNIVGTSSSIQNGDSYGSPQASIIGSQSDIVSQTNNIIEFSSSPNQNVISSGSFQSSPISSGSFQPTKGDNFVTQQNSVLNSFNSPQNSYVGSSINQSPIESIDSSQASFSSPTGYSSQLNQADTSSSSSSITSKNNIITTSNRFVPLSTPDIVSGSSFVSTSNDITGNSYGSPQASFETNVNSQQDQAFRSTSLDSFNSNPIVTSSKTVQKDPFQSSTNQDSFGEVISSSYSTGSSSSSTLNDPSTYSFSSTSSGSGFVPSNEPSSSANTITTNNGGRITFNLNSETPPEVNAPTSNYGSPLNQVLTNEVSFSSGLGSTSGTSIISNIRDSPSDVFSSRFESSSTDEFGSSSSNLRSGSDISSSVTVKDAYGSPLGDPQSLNEATISDTILSLSNSFASTGSSDIDSSSDDYGSSFSSSLPQRSTDDYGPPSSDSISSNVISGSESASDNYGSPLSKPLGGTRDTFLSESPSDIFGAPSSVTEADLISTKTSFEKGAHSSTEPIISSDSSYGAPLGDPSRPSSFIITPEDIKSSNHNFRSETPEGELVSSEEEGNRGIESATPLFTNLRDNVNSEYYTESSTAPISTTRRPPIEVNLVSGTGSVDLSNGLEESREDESEVNLTGTTTTTAPIFPDYYSNDYESTAYDELAYDAETSTKYEEDVEILEIPGIGVGSPGLGIPGAGNAGGPENNGQQETTLRTLETEPILFLAGKDQDIVPPSTLYGAPPPLRTGRDYGDLIQLEPFRPPRNTNQNRTKRKLRIKSAPLTSSDWSKRTEERKRSSIWKKFRSNLNSKDQ